MRLIRHEHRPAWAARPTRFRTSTAFLANTPSAHSVPRRHERAERRSTTAPPGMRHIAAAVLRRRSRRTSGSCRPNLTLNYGLRYDYYTPLTAKRQPDRQVQHRHGHARSEHRRRSTSRRRTTSSRASPRPTRRARPCCAAASACSSGPARPKTRSSRSRATASARRSAAVRCSPSRSTRRRWSPTSPATRTTAATSRAPTPTNTRSRRRSTSTRRRCSRSCRDGLTATAAYVGSQGRNLFLRSVGEPDRRRGHQPEPGQRGVRRPRVLASSSVTRPASVTRRPEPVRRGRLQDQRRPRQLQRDELSLTRRSAIGLTMNVQYTLGRSRGNTGGSNEAQHRRQQRADARPSSTTTTATTTSTSATRST